jgi:hypothetical protein
MSTCKITCSSLTSSRMSSIRLSRGSLYPPGSVVDEDGQRISEWRVGIDDIGEFLKLSSISQHRERSE